MAVATGEALSGTPEARTSGDAVVRSMFIDYLKVVPFDWQVTAVYSLVLESGTFSLLSQRVQEKASWSMELLQLRKVLFCTPCLSLPSGQIKLKMPAPFMPLLLRLSNAFT